MATEADDEISEETRLTKGDRTPKEVEEFENSDVLTLTGDTIESKVKAYAAEATIMDLNQQLKIMMIDLPI